MPLNQKELNKLYPEIVKIIGWGASFNDRSTHKRGLGIIFRKWKSTSSPLRRNPIPIYSIDLSKALPGPFIPVAQLKRFLEENDVKTNNYFLHHERIFILATEGDTVTRYINDPSKQRVYRKKINDERKKSDKFRKKRLAFQRKERKEKMKWLSSYDWTK